MPVRRHATPREELELEPALIIVVDRLVELLRISRNARAKIDLPLCRRNLKLPDRPL